MKNPIDSRTHESPFQSNRWRPAFLNVVMRSSAGLGFILLLLNIPGFRGVERAVFSVVLLVVLIATFAPLQYSIRVGTLLIAGYFIGVYLLMQFGPWSSGAVIYFLGITLCASFLYDERLDRWVFAINMATILSIGALNLLGALTLNSTEIPDTRLLDWLSYIGSYIVFTIVLTWAINLLKNELRSVENQYQSTLSALSNDRAEIENRINERTAILIRKNDQLLAASNIARQTADINDPETFLNAVVNLIADQYDFYHAGIFLMNEPGDEITLQAASSEDGKKLVERGYSFKVDTNSIVGLSAYQKKPRIALDSEADDVFLNNPDIPKTRSEMTLPLIVHDRVLGVLDIQSDQPQAFSVDDLDVLQTLADQIAVAIENMRQLGDARTALMQVEALTAARTHDAWSQQVKDRSYTYTYTPLGMLAGKSSKESDQAINIPITLRGQKIGTISMARKNKVPWSNIEVDMVNEVATQTGLAVDNVRLVEEATERARLEQTVGELSTRFSQSTDIDSLLQTAARELGQLPDVAEVSVFISQMPDQTPQKKRARRSSG